MLFLATTFCFRFTVLYAIWKNKSAFFSLKATSFPTRKFSFTFTIKPAIRHDLLEFSAPWALTVLKRAHGLSPLSLRDMIVPPYRQQPDGLIMTRTITTNHRKTHTVDNIGSTCWPILSSVDPDRSPMTDLVWSFRTALLRLRKRRNDSRSDLRSDRLRDSDDTICSVVAEFTVYTYIFITYQHS